MNAKLQTGIAVTALAGLLTGPAAQATDVAELPLKASVLAKPTVIFGMDDSGSMDWEVLLDTNSGVVWWNSTTATAWDSSTGKPLRSSNRVPYSYLFPLGSNAGGQLYAYNDGYGQAAPPISQFAWLRSSHFNPLYYDSMVTYAPWPPAYVDNDGDADDDGSKITYANASTSATLSHPLYPSGPSLAVGSTWNSSNSLFDDNGYMFYVQGKMKLPVGTYVIAQTTTSGLCRPTGSGKSATYTWRTLTAETEVGDGYACWAAIPYFPATFWHAENCSGTDCITGPDGSTKLKRYEIKTGNTFPSGRTVSAELQNFANWFTYYRKRKLMLAGSMGEVLEGLTGLRLGVVPFNNYTTVKMYDTDVAADKNNGLAVSGLFYRNGLAANGTPTHATVKHIASQFEGNTNVVKYACQRNSMFIVTDGFSNTTSIEVPSYDASLYGGKAPYTTTPTGSLADLALAYYTNPLRATGDNKLASGKVPPSSSTHPNADKNPNLHINTYAISLGVRGSLWPNTVDPFETAPTWPTPVADDPSMIDDQWHATINGRGLMFLASNPAETAAGIQKVLDDIISQTGAQGGVAVSTVNLSRGDSRAYFGTYDPAGWRGDLAAYPIDAATGEVSAGADDKIWSAADKLDKRDWTTRIIGTANNNAGLPFTVTNVADTVNPSDKYGADADVINYLRGDRSKEAPNGDFRARLSRMGAVINSEPAVQRAANVVYVQSGEGMLHAIDTAPENAGKELWAFVPRSVLANIGQTVERGYVFSTQLDGSPTLGTYAGGTLLVAGTGAAGRSYHALNVSSPRDWTETSFVTNYEWEFPGASDTGTAAKVGQALGRPRIVKTANDGYVVLITSGYNSTADGHGRLWMLNASTGEVIHEFDTGAGDLTTAEGGLAQVSAFLEDDGTVRYVYGGDLLGNVWRFDLQDKGTPHQLAVLKDANGVAQPVTAAPELMMAEGKRVVLIGTGRLLDIGDFGSTGVQSFYAIADGTTLSNARSSLVQQTYTPSSDTITSNPVSWASDRGWFLDLPAGQQANTQPSVAYGAVAFTTNTAGGTDCTASSRLYVLDVLSGSKYSGTDFVSSEISSTANSSGVTALLTSKGKIVGSGQDADGKPWERDIAKNSKIDPAKNSWREIRR